MHTEHEIAACQLMLARQRDAEQSRRDRRAPGPSTSRLAAPALLAESAIELRRSEYKQKGHPAPSALLTASKFVPQSNRLYQAIDNLAPRLNDRRLPKLAV